MQSSYYPQDQSAYLLSHPSPSSQQQGQQPSQAQPQAPPSHQAASASSLEIVTSQGNDEDSDDTEGKPSKRTGRRKIKIEYIEDKSRRHITFSKRKAGIMKKAYELSTLTGTQVLLLVVSETGLVYTFTTPKLQPLVTKPEGKNLIQSCLNAPDTADEPGHGPGMHSSSDGLSQAYRSPAMGVPPSAGEDRGSGSSSTSVSGASSGGVPPPGHPYGGMAAGHPRAPLYYSPSRQPGQQQQQQQPPQQPQQSQQQQQQQAQASAHNLQQNHPYGNYAAMPPANHGRGYWSNKAGYADKK